MRGWPYPYRLFRDTENNFVIAYGGLQSPSFDPSTAARLSKMSIIHVWFLT